MNSADEAAQHPLTEPTNEYTMRHAANLLNRTFGVGTENAASMSKDDLEVIDFAYQQLHRAANTLHAAQQHHTDTLPQK